MRRLTLYCDSGLANRMRILVSGRVIARARGADFEMLWPLMATCGCAFERLFEARPDVRTVSAETVAGIPDARGFWGTVPDDRASDGASSAGKPVSEGVRAQLTRRFGARVVSATPRSLDRASPEAIEDALSSCCLRRTQAVVGTRASSFSELAAFGRAVPFDQPEGTPAQWRRYEEWAQRAGLHPRIMRRATQVLGFEPQTFFLAVRALRYALSASKPVMAFRKLTGIKRRPAEFASETRAAEEPRRGRP